MKIQIDGEYTDGHEHLTTRDVDEFDFDKHHDADDYGQLDANDPQDYLEAVHNYLFEWTGDGHGIENHRLGYYCEITILESTNPELVNKTFEYDG